ncbi:hypothetical protein C1H46_036396 [Malus baccata]|uniref:Uncharacterized protein n=1 Tax=Malus baccata TaxID=106549 RepID=A0A540KUY7_MALBA|nr:hypothetical protein C1H46_036396 [Malus baccata]
MRNLGSLPGPSDSLFYICFQISWGVLEKERQSDATAKTETFIAPESSIGEVHDEFGHFADKNINWDALIEMHRISNQGADACSFPTSTGNFKKN